jgi:CRP-like cAMP-binding protein
MNSRLYMNTNLILNNVMRFSKLTQEEADAFVAIIYEKRVRRGEILVKPGEVCTEQYFINRGCMRVYYTNSEDVEFVLSFGVEDWWITDVASYYSGAISKLYVDAIEDSELLVVEKAAYDKLLEDYPVFNRVFREMLQRAYVANMTRILNDISLPGEERYIEFQKKYGYLEQRVLQRQVASYLGMTPEFLSKIRRKLASKH